jgi:2-isopropylmalate synthase
VIQRITDGEEREVPSDEIWDIFLDEYLPNPTNPWGRLALRGHRNEATVDGLDALSVDVVVDGAERTLSGTGNGPIAAFVTALAQEAIEVRVLDYHEHAMSSGGDARAAAYVECAVGDRVLWGVGVDANIVTASLKAVVSAVNRAAR